MCSSVETHGTPCNPGRLEEYYRNTIGGVDWCGFGRGAFPPSRDSYTGLMWGMACAYKLVDDPQVRKTIQGLVTSMLRHLVFEGRWNVHTPPGQPIKTTFLHDIALQLALLRLGKTVDAPEAASAYEHFADASEQCWVPEWGATWDPITKYYGLNLSHGVFGTLLLLEDDPKRRLNYRFAFAMIRRTVRHHRNAYFNMVRVLTELPPERPAALAEPSGFAPHLTLAAETRLLLQEWLVRRHCVPGPRGLPVEVSPDPQFLMNMLDPHAPNRAVPYTPVGSQHSNDDLVARFALPLQKRPGADFIWQRPPFTTDLVKCGSKVIVKAGKPGLEAPGIDYLLPYWMARYFGAIAAG